MPHRFRSAYISGLLALASALLAGLLLFRANQVYRASAWPSPSPLPAYLAVYPKYGQLVEITDQPPYVIPQNPGTNDTSPNIPVPWQFGDVCVALDAAALLQPGQFWSATDVATLSKLAIDGLAAVGMGDMVDGVVDHAIVVNGAVVAETGGPYGMCWHGPTRAGYHQASFTFETLRYDWWYQIGY